MLRYLTKKNLSLISLVALFNIATINAQSLDFELKTSPDVIFDFNTIQKYTNGITVMNACELNIRAVGVEWDLYVGATTTNIGFWDISAQYSNSGADPPIDIMQLQFRNSSNTSIVPGFFTIQDIGTPTYIIGSSADDAAVNCPAQGTNTPGDYQTSPGCYKFRVDIKITPGLNPIYKSGTYTLRIDYRLVEDL